jgi:hypothetical protein
MQLNARALNTSVLNAALGADISLAGSAAILCTTTASVARGANLASSALAIATSVGGVALGKPLAATASSLMTPTAALAKDVGLGSTVAVLGSATATPSVGKPLAALASTLTTVAGSPVVAYVIAGVGSGAAAATGALDKGVSLNSVTSFAMALTGDIGIVKGLGGQITVPSFAMANLTFTHLNDAYAQVGSTVVARPSGVSLSASTAEASLLAQAAAIQLYAPVGDPSFSTAYTQISVGVEVSQTQLDIAY